MYSPYKVIARRWGFIGGGGSIYRVLDVRDGSFADMTVADIYFNIGEHLFAGRCFIPEKLDFPVIHLFDGDQYKLPIIKGNDCVDNDKVIVLFELVRGNQLVGYRVTDYAGGLTDLSLPEIHDYKDVGYWNARISGDILKPLGNFQFIKLAV